MCIATIVNCKKLNICNTFFRSIGRIRILKVSKKHQKYLLFNFDKKIFTFNNFLYFLYLPSRIAVTFNFEHPICVLYILQRGGRKKE